jgi:hypothetical protein
MEFGPRDQSNREREQSERYGGGDRYREYERQEDKGYADKGGHRERSEYHSEQHRQHWQKEERRWDR